MRTALSICVVLAVALGALGVHAGQNQWTPEDFAPVSGPASPRVELAVQRAGEQLLVALNVASFVPAADDVSVSLGLAAGKKAVLTDKDARVARAGGVLRYESAVPAASLVANESDWERLRIGVAVAWSGGALGQDRLRERFRHDVQQSGKLLNGGAPHAGLSPHEADWLPFNLVENALAVTDRKNRIVVAFEQPMDGKATIVIENEKGERVRNLVAGQACAKGSQRAEWDGLDDKGSVVPPGAYAWRSIHHPGVKPNYLFSFCNDGVPPWRTGSGTDMWGPDHSVLNAAAANKELTFMGGPCAESGYAMVAVDAEGIKRRNYNPVMGTGIHKVCLAADDTYLYAAHDGFGWGQHVDRNKPDWKAEQKITVTRFEIKTGNVAEYAKGKRFATVAGNEVGPGGAIKDTSRTSLQGLALAGGALYVSDYHQNRVLIVDPAKGEKTGELKLDKPGPLAACGSDLLAVSGAGVVRLTLPKGDSKPFLAAGALEPRGLAVDAQGKVYVSDARTHTVFVYDAGGKQAGQLGKPGGAYGGLYDPQRMINPNALAVAANGWLWVCEERGNPKRCVAWDFAAGKVAKEKFGPTAYGASGAGFDTEDHTRWLGQGGLWKLDFDKKSSALAALLDPPSPQHAEHDADIPRNYAFHRQDGRTFLIGVGNAIAISELKPDGTAKRLAFVGSTHRYCFGCGWNPPKAFLEAFEKAYPNLKGKHADKGPGVMWVDLNGDGDLQPDEFDFSTGADNFAGAYWGHFQKDLTLRFPITAKGKRSIVTLKPDGYHPGGAPKYPPLNAACAAGVPIDLYGNEVETAVDRFGDLICNSDPQMKCFAPDGKLLWTYPNRWTNVHGSHNAPLPETGVMQGTLFFLGMAPLDDKADVFVMNGNHGRFFVLTSDGLYLDEMFKDVRMGASLDAYLIGGECFGGCFGKSAKDGHYYLQSGHTDYRIFRLDGLQQARRAAGTLTVRPEQTVAAERALARKAAQQAAKKEAAIPFVVAALAIDGKENDWKGEPAVRWDKSGQFPVQVRAAYDAQHLYLLYSVSDSSPWVNNGKDSTLLFKTGDSVDLQIGTNAAANPNRTQPAPGDIRLLIAPFQGKTVAVLYRHRLAQKDNPVTFTCPWRSETVDSVKALESARIAVTREGGRYRVEAAIPLADLGLAAPDGKTFKADFGVIFGDPDGTINMLRSYWSNQNTMLVNDVPGEIMLSPSLWGTVKFSGK